MVIVDSVVVVVELATLMMLTVWLSLVPLWKMSTKSRLLFLALNLESVVVAVVVFVVIVTVAMEEMVELIVVVVVVVEDSSI